MKKLLLSNEGHKVHTQWFLSLGSLCRQDVEIRETHCTGSCSDVWAMIAWMTTQWMLEMSSGMYLQAHSPDVCDCRSPRWVERRHASCNEIVLRTGSLALAAVMRAFGRVWWCVRSGSVRTGAALGGCRRHEQRSTSACAAVHDATGRCSSGFCPCEELVHHVDAASAADTQQLPGRGLSVVWWLALNLCRRFGCPHGLTSGLAWCFFFFFFLEEEALHVSLACQCQQYQQTAKGNLWDWCVNSTTHHGGSCCAMASDSVLT